MNARRIVVDTPATPHFDFLFGRYRLSPWVIPYFSTIIPIRAAAASLRLAADFPGSDDVRWRLDELDQREIDWPRVERKIVPYLQATDQPQFFNALTIALLPLEKDLSALDRCFGNAHEWLAPELKDSERFEKTLTAGPIKCGFWTAWTEFSQAKAKTGQLRWNPDQVFAVALDGQHRLAAIKEFVKKKGKPDRHMDDTSVPVIFVVLDPAFGYVAPRPTPLVEVLRTVFIDLNKHAKIPTRAKQILLDDKDPASVCVRALIGGGLCDGTDELRQQPVRMPLSLVDWHTEQAKFDDGPYVTTILVLDWAIAELTGAKPVQDFTDYSAIRRQLKALAQSLAIDLSAAQKRLDGLEQFEMRPFGFSAMNALVDAVPNILHPECTFNTPDGEEQRFWLGTFLTADRGIDFTQSASRRGQEVIFGAVAMQMYDELVEPDTHSDFDDFWSKVGEADMSFTGRGMA